MPDITYQGVPCRVDHRCDLHSYKYYWCYIDTKNWDYCGVIEGSKCEYHVEASTKRAVGRNEPFQCYDRGNGRRTEFQYSENANIADGHQFRHNITNIISQWNNGMLRNGAGTLVRTGNFRIDLEDMVNRNNERYHNLQIQLNIPRQPGRSTTYSLVLVPENLEGVTDHYVRRPFTESFLRRVEVTILVQRIARQLDKSTLNPPCSVNQLLHYKQLKLFLDESTHVHNHTHA